MKTISMSSPKTPTLNEFGRPTKQRIRRQDDWDDDVSDTTPLQLKSRPDGKSTYTGLTTHQSQTPTNQDNNNISLNSISRHSSTSCSSHATTTLPIIIPNTPVNNHSTPHPAIVNTIESIEFVPATFPRHEHPQRPTPETHRPLAPQFQQSLHYTLNPDPAAELRNVRASRTRLVELLENSTALVNRLRTAGRVRDADFLARQSLHQEQRDRAVRNLARCRRRAAAAVAFLVAVIVLYVWWQWYNAVDLEYIRRRRIEVLYE
jgi:hypothetical protein